jgi:VWFA-related protein
VIARVAPVLLVLSGIAGQQTPLFRARTDLVFVPVSVKAGNAPIADLQVADFRLWDSGVEQKITGVAYEEVPIDVTLFVDNSGSTYGSHQQFNQDIREIVSLLRPVDRVRVVAFDLDVRVVMDWTRPGGSITAPTINLARLSSVYDGLALSMLHRPDPDRRHLIVALTDGVDYGSVVRSREIEDLAGRTEGVLHLLIVTTGSASFSSAAPGVGGTLPDDGAIFRLSNAARRTGGVSHTPILGFNVVQFFTRAFNDFRTSYLLQYTPAGVPTAAWHPIKVEVNRPGRLAVRHRQGYLVGSGVK